MVCFDFKKTSRNFTKKNFSKTHSLQFLVLRLKSFGGTKANLNQHASEEATKKQRIVPKKLEGNSIN